MSFQPSDWSRIDSEKQQDFAAAESLVQHSRSARHNVSQLENGLANPQEDHNYLPDQSQSSLNPMTVNSPQQPRFEQTFQNLGAQGVASGYNVMESGYPIKQELPTTFEAPVHSSPTKQAPRTFSGGSVEDEQKDHRQDDSKTRIDIAGRRHTSDSTTATKSKHSIATGTATQRYSHDEKRKTQNKEEKPAWTELKTKAGKERKRLPLACIACRRKKIRCSGENPTCKHCQRSRVPCVYKVTTRKAAPRTDYMAMLDRRLKRMEERVIKIIPKDINKPPIPRAVLKPSSQQSIIGKKRAADDAFGPQIDEWADSKPSAQSQRGSRSEESGINSEGAEYLPSMEIQEHLSEVFFDFVYGQSYHLMHKPSYMRKLRAGTLPPVLVLAVCAVSARFSIHPQVNSEPNFLRGEEWASPARNIALKRYDEPNIAILIVLTLLALHEFGTCQGGRSWTLAGMSTRMAYALQLHRELDYDPLGRKNDKKSELSFTDREIRRRAMWACFLMDRFTSSGTERPMFADEEAIKIQLPIKESHFRMDLPGPTESLDGSVSKPPSSDDEYLASLRENMGVAAYMVRVIALWGRVIKYLNMGGKEKDPHSIWEPNSQFADLKRQATEFISTLPSELRNTKANLYNHAVDKLGNQFIFLHVAANQVILFLHRYAIPTTPGASNPSGMPKSFLAEAGPAAVEAATNISILLEDALNYNAVAPFIGYCAFLSGTVHVWGIFSQNKSLENLCKKSLGSNVRYLNTMEKYWGMIPFMVKNLKDIYKEHAEAALKGTDDKPSKDATIFQYGDWFGRYPHGVSRKDYEDPSNAVKHEPSEEATLSQKPDLQTAEDFFQSLSSPSNKSTTSTKKSSRKKARPPANQKFQATPPPSSVQAPMQPDPVHQQPNVLSMSVGEPNQPPMTPYTPTHPQMPQLYPAPGSAAYPTHQDLVPLHTQANTALLPQLDRTLVYDAYAGNNDSSADIGALVSQMQVFNPNSGGPGGQPSMWDTSATGGDLDMVQQHPHQQHPQHAMMGGDGMPQESMGPAAGGFPGGLYSAADLQTSAWFMPFNMNPPELDGNENDIGRMGI